jgi:hypothetical protein
VLVAKPAARELSAGEVVPLLGPDIGFNVIVTVTTGAVVRSV